MVYIPYILYEQYVYIYIWYITGVGAATQNQIVVYDG
jgi:hypothetical protein